MLAAIVGMLDPMVSKKNLLPEPSAAAAGRRQQWVISWGAEVGEAGPRVLWVVVADVQRSSRGGFPSRIRGCFADVSR
eukprot:7044678-Prymnesium_polylepis.1